jgi:glutamate N-acetyltransferase / amino-acid N-acetyltransferase
VIAALPAVEAVLGSTADHAEMFATAIMTTDTKMKVARAVVDVDGTEVRIFGTAKGAGMIHPQLGAPVGPPHATMLVFLFTDLAAESEELGDLLQPAVERSFNSISIDGDTSTNDTVLLLASGASGVKLNLRSGEAFANALQLVCGSLAHQIVDDGEGVGHVVTLHITGARTEAEARQVAKAIAHSPLCKTAWSSGDPNWGRLLAAAGYSGVEFDPALVNITVGEQPVFALGVRSPAFDEAAAHAAMLAREYTITLDLGQGKAECRFLTCDLTEAYVRINAEYST